MESGHCFLVPDCNQLAEYLTLALCVGSLCVRVNEANPVAAFSGYVALFNRQASLILEEDEPDRACNSAPASLRAKPSTPQPAKRQRPALNGVLLQACGLRTQEHSAVLRDKDRDPVVITPQLNRRSWESSVQRTLSDTDSVKSATSQKRNSVKGGPVIYHGRRSQRANAKTNTGDRSPKMRKLFKRVSMISNDSLKLDRMDSFINAAFSSLDDYEALDYEVGFMGIIDEDEGDNTMADRLHTDNNSNQCEGDNARLLPKSTDPKRGKPSTNDSSGVSTKIHEHEYDNAGFSDENTSVSPNINTNILRENKAASSHNETLANGNCGITSQTENRVVTEAQIHHAKTPIHSEENDVEFSIRL